MNKKTIVNIQLLRAFAALAVVLFHTSAHFFAIGGNNSGNIFSFFKLFGYAGVDVFFVISGYIIWVSTRKITGISGVMSYVYNRVTRIYLGYWPYFIILLGLAYYFAPNFLEGIDYTGSFFLTQSYLNQLLLKVSWTLKYELYFYLCFAFLLLLPRKLVLPSLVLAFLLIVGIQLYGFFALEIYQPDNFHKGTPMYAFYLSPFCLEFLLGCFVGVYFENKRVKNLLPIIVIGVVSFIAALYYQENFIEGTLTWGYYINQRVMLFGLVAISMLISLIELEKRGKIFLPRFSLLLGGASYSLYLSHTIILYFMYHFGLRDYLKSIGGYQVGLMVLVVLVIVAYSILHYLLIEQPLMKGSRQFKKWIQKSINSNKSLTS